MPNGIWNIFSPSLQNNQIMGLQSNQEFDIKETAFRLKKAV
jgi:hypothetical protein